MAGPEGGQGCRQACPCKPDGQARQQGRQEGQEGQEVDIVHCCSPYRLDCRCQSLGGNVLKNHASFRDFSCRKMRAKWRKKRMRRLKRKRRKMRARCSDQTFDKMSDSCHSQVQVGCRNLTRPSHLPQHPKKRFAFLSCSHIFRIQSCHHWLRNVVQSLKLEIITFGCRLAVLT